MGTSGGVTLILYQRMLTFHELFCRTIMGKDVRNKQLLPALTFDNEIPNVNKDIRHVVKQKCFGSYWQ